MATDWITKAKLIMKQRGITQQDLVPVMGKTTRGAIGHYFTGRSEPSLEQLKNLAKFLGVSVNYLIGDEESAAVDKQLLESCVSIVEEVAAEQHIDLTSQQTAKIVAYLYQASVESNKSEETEVSRQTVFDLVHLIH